MSSPTTTPPQAPGRRLPRPGTRSAAPGPARPTRRGSRAARRLPYLLVLPTLVLLVGALGYPVGWQLVTSLRKYGLAQQFGQPPEWVGLGNYADLVQDPTLWGVVVRSVVFCVATAAVTVVLGCGVALLMNAVDRWVRLVLQVSLLLAWAMPIVAAMTVWIWIVDWRRGLLNWLLERVGVDAAGHNWLAEPLSFFVVASAVVVWMSVPFVALSVYAGLTQVSQEVVEASMLDGAGWAQRLRHIVFPLIAPVLSIVMLLQLIWDLRVFTQIKLLQEAGSVPSETDLLGTYVYRVGTGTGDFGTASAVSVLILVLTVALSWRYVRSLMSQEI